MEEELQTWLLYAWKAGAWCDSATYALSLICCLVMGQAPHPQLHCLLPFLTQVPKFQAELHVLEFGKTA